MEEIQYIGECEHLFCNDIHNRRCIKRYFSLYQIGGGYKRIAVCNDKLKLLIQKGIAENTNEFYSDRLSDSFHYSRLSKEIFSDFIKREYYDGFQSFSTWHICGDVKGVDFLKTPVIFTANKKLEIYLKFTMEEALNMYIDNGWNLKDNIIDSLERYIDSHSKYKKYKGLMDKFESIIKKLNRGVYGDESKTIIITELISIVIQLKSKK